MTHSRTYVKYAKIALSRDRKMIMRCRLAFLLFLAQGVNSWWGSSSESPVRAIVEKLNSHMLDAAPETGLVFMHMWRLPLHEREIMCGMCVMQSLERISNSMKERDIQKLGQIGSELNTRWLAARNHARKDHSQQTDANRDAIIGDLCQASGISLSGTPDTLYGNPLVDPRFARFLREKSTIPITDEPFKAEFTYRGPSRVKCFWRGDDGQTVFQGYLQACDLPKPSPSSGPILSLTLTLTLTLMSYFRMAKT